MPPLTQAQIDRAKYLLDSGLHLRAVAREIGCSRALLRLKIGPRSPADVTPVPQKNDNGIRFNAAHFINYCSKKDDRYFGRNLTELRRFAYDYVLDYKLRKEDYFKICSTIGRIWLEHYLVLHPEVKATEDSLRGVARFIGRSLTRYHLADFTPHVNARRRIAHLIRVGSVEEFLRTSNSNYNEPSLENPTTSTASANFYRDEPDQDEKILTIQRVVRCILTPFVIRGPRRARSLRRFEG